MRILFVHQNFPAQFVHLAPELARRGHDVRALTVETNKKPAGIPVATYAFEPPGERAHRLTAAFELNAERGAAVARRAATLRDQDGYVPDVIFGHIGWGESMFLKEVWPQTHLIVYAELFWRARGLYYGFDPGVYPAGLEGTLTAATTTASMLATMHNADRALSPTRWQARSFPEDFQRRITVIHDGIDTDKVAPSAAASVTIKERNLTLRPGDEVLTFVNRTLEPHRGFHIFMRALPAVLRARRNAHVVIVGGTEGGYGAPPASGRSWREILLEEVGGALDMERVHFVGKVPHTVFVDLMRGDRARTPI